MRIAGIDYGTKRIGVALADRATRIATPHATYGRRNEPLDREYFLKLVGQENIDLFVLGLPVHLSGDESEKSVEARLFGSWLHSVTDVPVVYFDERYTSLEAEEILNTAGLTRKQRKGRRDQLAAQIMLAAYLESLHTGSEPPPPFE
jgi:putative Holliday junction resolvase